jgi:hypothetical protein
MCISLFSITANVYDQYNSKQNLSNLIHIECNTLNWMQQVLLETN